MSLFEKKPRKGQAPDKLPRDEFQRRFLQRFMDPAFDAERDALARVAEIAFQSYAASRKAPLTEKAGPDFEDPDYDLSSEWLAARSRIQQAAARQKDSSRPSRVLCLRSQ
jgi:hypothetical protein